jgi:hypothetical protein
MFNKWITFGCILGILISTGVAFVKVNESRRLQEMLQEQQKSADQFQLDASRERKTWDELYRSCVAENSLLREKLQDCQH